MAVVGRAALCSRLAPNDSHGSHQCSTHQESAGKYQLGTLRHCARIPLRMCSKIMSPASAAAVQIAPRRSSQWGQAASVGAPPAEAETPGEVAEGGRSGIHVGQIAVQGLRDDMEDDVLVQEGPLGFTFAAVFDGHAGFSSAQFLREELYKDCVQCLEGGALLESDDPSAVKEALTQAFLQTDSRLLSWLDSCSDDKEKDSGSTATVAFVRKDSAIIAHVGDSRAVLSRGGKAVDLSGDHRPFGNSKMALSEIKRVKEAGAWVSHGRLCASLSISRAFGDPPFKTQKKQMLEEGIQERRWTTAFAQKLNIHGEWLVATPEVCQIKLEEDAEFIIIGSDGLWDSFKSNDAVQFVRKQLREHGDPQRACEAITQATLERHGQDNISVIILDFGRITKEESATFKWW